MGCTCRVDDPSKCRCGFYDAFQREEREKKVGVKPYPTAQFKPDARQLGPIASLLSNLSNALVDVDEITQTSDKWIHIKLKHLGCYHINPNGDITKDW